jgi:VanZ family protein
VLKSTIRILAWVTLAGIFAATISPIKDRPDLAAPIVERAGAFFLVGLLFCLGYRRHWPLAVVVVLLAAISFEAAQLLTSDRHAEIADALVKTAGGMAGIGIGLLTRHKVERPSRRDKQV